MARRKEINERESEEKQVDVNDENFLSQEHEVIDGWVKLEELDDLNGPLCLLTNGSSPYVASFLEDGSIRFDESSSSNSFEPESVSQVLLGKPILPTIFALKTAFGKYLSSDHIGNVSANHSAIGPSENWTPLLVDGMVAFRNFSHKYLSFDPEKKY